MDERVEKLLQIVADRDGSDMLFAPGAAPTARIDGQLVRLGLCRASRQSSGLPTRR